MAINKLKAVEMKLMNEVDIEFGENPFLLFLANDNHTEDEIERILSKKVLESFGPSEESFLSLLKEIELFKPWEKIKLTPLDLIPQSMKCTDVTHDTVTLSWDNIDCACFYEIELRSLIAGKSIYHSTESQYTIFELKPLAKYHIHIRTVISQNSKSGWCNPIIVHSKEQPFIWKKCPDYIDQMNYFVDENNPRIALNTNQCTIIGNASLPLNEVTSWNIKILNSLDKDHDSIYVGIAPFDINQNEGNYKKCGWYFDRGNSTLCSGPPHSYEDKEYGPRK